MNFRLALYSLYFLTQVCLLAMVTWLVFQSSLSLFSRSLTQPWLWPMTLTFESDLDMVKLNHNIEVKIRSKVIIWTCTQSTDCYSCVSLMWSGKTYEYLIRYTTLIHILCTFSMAGFAAHMNGGNNYTEYDDNYRPFQWSRSSNQSGACVCVSGLSYI